MKRALHCNFITTYTGLPAKLLKSQKNKCTSCGLNFRPTDIIEVDHIVPRSVGGKDTYENIQLLHRHCHDVKTAEDLKAVNFLKTHQV